MHTKGIIKNEFFIKWQTASKSNEIKCKKKILQSLDTKYLNIDKKTKKNINQEKKEAYLRVIYEHLTIFYFDMHTLRQNNNSIHRIDRKKKKKKRERD